MIEQQPESQASRVIAGRSATDRSRAGSARPGSCGAFEDLLSDVSSQLFGHRFIGTHIDLVEVSTERARTVGVESPDINAYADGDYVCPLPTDISAVPGELRILVPARTRP
jgi:hypothetical protein